jgi:NAD(P)-dependent dehydrogenase (short-subunit alcohol dehydrogenase family)
MGRVAERVAVVTGAGGGIGRASAALLAAEGAFVFATDVDEAGGMETCAIIARAGGEAAFMRLDVVDEEAWRSVMDAVWSRKGALHILVNNAGICLLVPLLDMTLASWRRQMAVNLDGVFLGTRAAIPPMARSGGGSIINVSSGAGLTGVPLLSGYCATKGGVRLFSKAAALECARLRNGIRVNSVHPGGVETPIWAKMSHDGDLPPDDALETEMAEKRAWTVAVTPLGYAGEPADIAAGVLYLASNESRFVTGSELVIDGGASAA